MDYPRNGYINHNNQQTPPGEGSKQGFSRKWNIFGFFSKKYISVGIFAILAFLVFGGSIFWLLKSYQQNTEPGIRSIEIWDIWHDPSVIKPLLTEYEQRTGIKINYVFQSPQDYRERLISFLARRKGPDIFIYHNTWVSMLDTFLDTLPPALMDAASYQKIFYPVAYRDLRKNPGIVGIPIGFDGLGLYINEDIFRESGESIPTTWDDFRRVAIALTDSEKGIFGAALGSTKNVDHWQDVLSLMLLQNGTDPGQPKGNLASDALSFFVVFSQKDGVWNEILPPSTRMFASGKLAMYFGPSWRSFEIKRLNPKLRFKVVPVPQLPLAGVVSKKVTWASYWVYGVNVDSPVKKEAWELLRFLTQKENLERLSTQARSQNKLFFPYPRQDMANLLKDDPVFGAYVEQAPTAASWYLASNTYDGDTGINTVVSNIYKDAVSAILNGKNPSDVVEEISVRLQKTLTKYRVE